MIVFSLVSSLATLKILQLKGRLSNCHRCRLGGVGFDARPPPATTERCWANVQVGDPLPRLAVDDTSMKNFLYIVACLGNLAKVAKFC